MTLDDIMGRCRVEDGHWLWAGALSKGVPRIWAPDFTLHAGEMRSQTGKRAVWHVKTGKAIPDGWRVFGNCREPLCLNPTHVQCERPAARGVKVAASGVLKGQVLRIIANRSIGRQRSNLTPELLQEIATSPETGMSLQGRLGIPHQTISRVRNGQMRAFQPVGGLFTGLVCTGSGT